MAEKGHEKGLYGRTAHTVFHGSPSSRKAKRFLRQPRQIFCYFIETLYLYYTQILGNVNTFPCMVA